MKNEISLDALRDAYIDEAACYDMFDEDDHPTPDEAFDVWLNQIYEEQR